MKAAYFYFLVITLLAACSPIPTPIPSPTETVTLSPSPTFTLTIPPSWTHAPTLTPSFTLSPTNTFTPTPSETQAPLVPAQLFNFIDAYGHTINWSYAQVSSLTTNEADLPKTLSGFLAFQLIDRAIHRQTVSFDNQILTIYYLNVQHEFSDQLLPVKLILSATKGTDISLSLIPAGGNAYIRIRILLRSDNFNAFSFHRDANMPYADRSQRYPDVLLIDLEKLLPTLPTEMIVLADAQILFDPDSLAYIVKYNIDTVPYLAARAMPFLTLDAYNRITGPSPEATSLMNLLVNHKLIPEGIPFFSSDTLVLVLNTNQIPTVP